MSENEVSIKGKDLSDNDSVITIVLDGRTSIPKAVNFKDVNAFQLLSIGQWLTLKGRQMVVASEAAELAGINTAAQEPDGSILKP